MELKDPLRFHTHYGAAQGSPYAGGSSFMERMSEKVASGMGTVAFIIVSSLLIVAWVVTNGAAHYISTTITNIGKGRQFDPEPWILLNLIFSAVAFYTGALVIIAQKAQTRTDKANEEASAKHREELGQFQLELLQTNTTLTQQIHTLAEQIHTLTEQGEKRAEQMRTLTEDVHRVTCKSSAPPPETM